mmetsp:Transcript_23341/g.66968  ORF Transcript_23341/g.66968 Transcript_23341/m.66968 type:complete len:101 (-) Transcript_23341:279-581(-)
MHVPMNDWLAGWMGVSIYQHLHSTYRPQLRVLLVVRPPGLPSSDCCDSTAAGRRGDLVPAPPATCTRGLTRASSFADTMKVFSTVWVAGRLVDMLLHHHC